MLCKYCNVYGSSKVRALILHCSLRFSESVNVYMYSMYVVCDGVGVNAYVWSCISPWCFLHKSLFVWTIGPAGRDSRRGPSVKAKPSIARGGSDPVLIVPRDQPLRIKTVLVMPCQKEMHCCTDVYATNLSFLTISFYDVLITFPSRT